MKVLLYDETRKKGEGVRVMIRNILILSIRPTKENRLTYLSTHLPEEPPASPAHLIPPTGATAEAQSDTAADTLGKLASPADKSTFEMQS